MNEELKAIYKADQEDRSDTNLTNEELWKEVRKRDEARMKRVKEMIKEKLLKVGEDYYNAAMIFQHGSSIKDYETANKLAEKSMKLGYERAKWLYAASLDRWMLHRGDKHQKFGTQYHRNQEGLWEFKPVDPNTTDAERKKYNVPTAAQQRKREKELNKKGLRV